MNYSSSYEICRIAKLTIAEGLSSQQDGRVMDNKLTQRYGAGDGWAHRKQTRSSSFVQSTRGSGAVTVEDFGQHIIPNNSNGGFAVADKFNLQNNQASK